MNDKTKNKKMISTSYEEFSLQVKSANQIFTESFELDKNVVAIKGMKIDADRNDLAYYRGSQRMEISKKEIFPDNYLTQRLMVGINVGMNERYRDLRSPNPGNRIIKVDYKDSDAFGTVFTPYTVNFSFECEIDDTI